MTHICGCGVLYLVFGTRVLGVLEVLAVLEVLGALEIPVVLGLLSTWWSGVVSKEVAVLRNWVGWGQARA